MEDVTVDFSKKELNNFLTDLGKQIEHGKVGIHIPGKSEGAIQLVPEKPINIKFNYNKKEEEMDITIRIKERRQNFKN